MGYSGSVNETGGTLYIYGWGGDRRQKYAVHPRPPRKATVVKLFDAKDTSYSVLGNATIKDERSWFKPCLNPLT